MITEITFVAPNRFKLTFSGNDGNFFGEQELEKVGEKIKIWRSIRLKPDEKAFILNGKIINTGEDVALLERCR
jgi:hypothetical protein